MANFFVHFDTKAGFLAATKGTEYTNKSIVFIKDTQEIWTHDEFYAIPDAYKNRITTLEEAVEALKASIKQTGDTLQAEFELHLADAAEGLKNLVPWTDGNHNRIALPYVANPDKSAGGDAAGQIIGIPNPDALSIEGGVAPNGNAVLVTLNKWNVQEFGSGRYPTNINGSGARPTYNDGKEIALLEDVESIDVTEQLKDYAKSVDVTQEIADAVEDLVSNTELADTLEDYSTTEEVEAMLENYVNDASYNEEKKEIELKNGETVIAKIDAKPFIKDGMVDSVKVEAGNLVITFNTDSGKEDIELDITEIFNANNYYTKKEVDDAIKALNGGVLKLSAVEIKDVDYEDYVEPSAEDTIDAAVGKLATGVRSVKSYVDDLFSWAEY